ncbi:hypothetical protein KI387_009204, partial [Taxus chinensis]
YFVKLLRCIHAATILMGSAANNNNSGGYDMQNFFNTGNPGNLAPPAPTQHPFHHPFSNPSNFPYQTPAPSSIPFPFPPSMYQNNNNPAYMNYSQAPSQFRLNNPIPNPSSDGARLMALINNNHCSPNSMEASPSSLASSSSSLSSPEPTFSPAFAPTAPPVNLAPPQRTPSRLLSTKLPRGRHLHGDHVVYDIDLRFSGEAQPQLEVSPITVYGSDPVLVGGRQIAVNKNYICYGLRAGTIRVLNINTALRALLRGHSQRVIDMAFFSNDVHLLVSSSSDGRIFIRKIEEGPGEDDKRQITEKIVLGIQILGDWESVYPRICWHSHQQDVLFVGVSNYVLKIDITKAKLAAPGGVFSAEDPLQFHVDSLIEGVYCIGKHEDDVTDLSICRWSVTCLASASKDGTVKIWGEKKMIPFAVLKPHDGRPVGAVGFLDMPNSVDNIVLFTAGPLNQELKLWVSANLDGRFSPSSGKWHCSQTLELKSSLESRNEDAFFNQVLVVARASVILLANAKKNAIYAVHVECHSKPAATRMDYLAEFSVAMPILSFTATTENVTDGEGTVQIYCVQTQAIQQYALEMSQCFPPPAELASSEEDAVSRTFEKSTIPSFAPLESSHGINIAEMTVSSGMKSPGPINIPEASTCKSPVCPSTPHAHGHHVVPCADTTSGLSMPTNVSTDNAPLSSQVPVPLSPRLSRRLSGMKSPVQVIKDDVSPVSSVEDLSDKQTVQEHSIERKSDAVMMTLSDMGSLEAISTTCKGDDRFSAEEEREMHASQCSSSTIGGECQASSSQSYLRTPSQLTSMALPSDSDKGSNIHNAVEETGANAENENVKAGDNNCSKSCSNLVEGACLKKGPGSVPIHIDSQASQASNTISKEIGSLPSNEVTVEEGQLEGDNGIFEDREHSPNASVEGSQENIKDTSCRVPMVASTSATSQSPSGAKRRKNKNKNMSALLPSSSPSGTPFTSVGSSDGEPSTSMIIPSPENLAAQVVAMQEALSQLVAMQKELPNKMVIAVSSPVTKEGKRVEAALGLRMEKFLKAQMDALWARIQEENAKRERSERQLTAMLTNILNKELPATLERLLKKEISSLGTPIARLVTPNVEKAISTSINDAFQKGVSDKALSLLEKSLGSKLESAVSRQIQTQFQSSGKQVLQDALRTCFEGSVIPAFEHSCKAMFEQVDTAFREGMSEHTTAAQHQFSASHSALASTLQDTVASASSLAQSLKAELADGQRKLLALAESARASPSRVGALNTTKSNGSLGGLAEAISLEHLEESLDPTKELSRLVSECKFEEAFNKALTMNDVSIVSWLCSQVDPKSLFLMVPLPLSQGVLLALVQQLGHDLEHDIGHKLVWIREASTVLNPNDPLLVPHMRPILGQ